MCSQWSATEIQHSQTVKSLLQCCQVVKQQNDSQTYLSLITGMCSIGRWTLGYSDFAVIAVVILVGIYVCCFHWAYHIRYTSSAYEFHYCHSLWCCAEGNTQNNLMFQIEGPQC